jgi:hypothetical protein
MTLVGSGAPHARPARRRIASATLVLALLCTPWFAGPWSTAAEADTGSDTDWSWTDISSGAPNSWSDLRTSGGIDLGFTSQGDSATLTLPFSFSFYGVTYSSVTIYPYGVVVPGSASAAPGPWSAGTCVDNGSVSGPIIAPYWSSFDPTLGGAVYYRSFPNGVIIEWDGVFADVADTSDQKVGLIVYKSGELAFLWKDTRSGSLATSRGRGTTIGVQDGTGDGLRFSCDVQIMTSFDNGRYLTPWGTRQLSGDLDVTAADAMLNGAGASERFGYAVSAAGDLDGDSIAELIVGAPFADGGATNGGGAWLFLGNALSGTVSQSDAFASILGSGASDTAGTSLRGGGDVDGDGIPDLILGAPEDDPGSFSNAGSAAIFLGSTLVSGGSFSYDSADALFSGENAGDAAGTSVDLTGDVNGDGYDDILVGAPEYDGAGSNVGIAYYLTGGPGLSDLDLGSADASWYGEASDDAAGTRVRSVGDLDADGYDDIAISATGNDDGGTEAGATYIVLGDVALSSSKSVRTASEVAGASAGDAFGSAIAPAGDLTGDGYADLLIGGWDAGAGDAGGAWLVKGSRGAFAGSAATAHSRFTGGTGDHMGTAIAPIQLDDSGSIGMAVGAYASSGRGSNGGSVYIVGPADFGLTGSVDASTVAEGTLTTSEANAYLGFSLDVADWNGDDYDDVATGAYGADGDATSSGVVYLFHGEPSYVDLDGDGHLSTTDGGLDCDDSDVTSGPANIELCNGLDDNCDGQIDEDFEDTDGDGTADCLDSEVCDGLDNNGDGSIDEGMLDTDGDSLCDQLDSEECDGLDNDGDGGIDEGYDDHDFDGIADCMDVEECDGYDNDGDGVTDPGEPDTDGDGVADCADYESCDGLDNDGDGSIDEDFEDTDRDGTADCIDDEDCDGIDNNGDGRTDEGTEDSDGDGLCDDIDFEDCDGIDNDGDGLIDEDFVDGDDDGVADCIDGEDCDGIDNNGDGTIDEGYSDVDHDTVADCVDNEECDGIDNDGDGIVDEGYPDHDYDGRADCMDAEDCDGVDNDGDGQVDVGYPDVDGDGTADCVDAEECDGVDNDGDGIADEGYADRDGDGAADCVDPPSPPSDDAKGDEEGYEGGKGCSTSGGPGDGASWSILAMLGASLTLGRRRRP